MNKGYSNNHDFVPSIQYKLSRTKKQLLDLSLLELISKFNILNLNNIEGSSHIPYTTDLTSLEALFSLFFTDSVLDIIVRCTNLNAERVRADLINSRALNIRFHNSLN
jgi:hypothetical protein